MATTKSATGYYILHVLRAIGIDLNQKDLYVKLEIGENVQRTKTILSASDDWDERLPIRAPSAKSEIMLTLSRKVVATPFTLDIGANRIKLADLLKRKEEKEEIELELTERKQADPPRLVVSLVFSDVKTNASVTLNNLLPLVDNDGELASSSKRMDEAGSTIDNVLSQGKAIMRDKSTIVNAFPQIDGIVEAMDNIAQAHPLLNLGWQLVTIAYKVVSDQKKLDERLNNLLRSAAFAFSFAQDASLLSEDDNRLQSIYGTIVQLMNQIIECCLFIREIVRYNFFRRLWTQAADAKKVEKLENGFGILKENLKIGVDLQLGLVTKDMVAGFGARAAVDVLREIRLTLGLTPIMLAEMESSTHQECTAGTREEWIDQIIAWLLSETAEEVAFLVNGIPGSGKSTLAQTIARHPKIKNYLKSHIFFKRENTARHDIFILIAYRLAMSNAAVAAAILRRLDRPRLGPRETFTNLILEPLLEAEKEGKLEEPIVIILDALDEFGTPDSREAFLQLISDDFSKLPRCVRFLITSRPEYDLTGALTNRKHIRKANLEVNTEESRRDVQMYIATEMKKIVPNKAEGKQWEKMMKQFGLAADGLFIWASLAIRLVRSATRPYKKMCELTNNRMHLTLDDLYREALQIAAIDWSDSGDCEIFAMLFTLILPNRGSLSVELFDLLLSFEEDSSALFIRRLQCFVSGGDLEPVQVYHKTFTDYLQSDKRTPDESWYIDVPHWNNIILCRCFMAMEELRYDMCGSVSGVGKGEIAVGEIQVHIIYASRYWSDHLKDAAFSSEALEDLRQFLNERLLFWFEILSSLKEFSRVAEKALINATEWVSSHDPELNAFLLDARSIISEYGEEISKNPKFIYSTALPLTSSTNRVLPQYNRLHENR